MTDRSLKKSPSGKTNRPVGDSDENLDLFSLNRCEDIPVTSLDVLFKQGRHSFEKPKVAKPELDDDKKHENDPLCTVPEVPLGTLSRLVLEARNVTFKLQSDSITRTTGSKNETTEPSSKPTRSNSTIRPSNIPSIRPTNIPSIRPSNIPTIRSSSAPKRTTTTSTSASTSTPKRTISRSLTPLSRKTPSRSPTPTISKTTSTISKATSTTPSFKRAGDAQRSRSLTPRSKPLITVTSTPLSSKTKVRSASVSSLRSVRPDGNTSVSAKPRTPPKLKERVTLSFGRPVGTTNSPKRNTSPDVTRIRPKVASPSSSSSLIPAFSGVSSHKAAATPKSVKSSATVADSTRSGRKVSKASVPMDVTRNVKVSPQPFLSTKLYPHSIRSSSSRLRKRSASEGSSSSNQEEEELMKSLTKEGDTEKNDSARYEALLNVEDVKDTNWLLNIDDDSHFSLIFDNAFDSPPDLFPPL